MKPSSAQRLGRLTRGIEHLSESTGRAIAWLTLAMVLVQFAVVVLRYVFSIGWIAVQESILYMHALVFLLGAAYTLKHDGHVRVDIFYRRLPPRARGAVDLLGTLLLLLPVCAFIFWVSWDYVLESWRLTEGSREAGGLPGVFLLKTTILIMAALFLLQGAAVAIRSLLLLAGSPLEDETRSPDHEPEL